MNNHKRFLDSLGISHDALQSLNFSELLIAFSILKSNSSWSIKKNKLNIALGDKADNIIKEVEKYER